MEGGSSGGDSGGRVERGDGGRAGRGVEIAEGGSRGGDGGGRVEGWRRWVGGRVEGWR